MSAQPQLSSLKQRLLERMLTAEAQRQVTEAPLEPRAAHERVPLAPCQHQLWLHTQLNPQAPLYNEPMTLHFHGRLDREALERAFEEMIQRHEIWRTTFAYVDGEVLQAIHDDLPIQIPFHDLSSHPLADRELEATRLATADAHRPFDLSVGPLMRARLVKLDEEQYRLFLVQHHLIHDGLTIYGVLMSELPAIYDAFAQGKPSPLAPPRLQFGDFALWQKRFLESNSGPQIAYWRKQLAGTLPALELPADRPRPPVFSFRGATADFMISPELAAEVRSTALREGATPFAFMLTVLKTLLFRYSGQEDILVGTPVDGRRRPEFGRMAGFITNIIAFRSRPSADRTFRDYLHDVKDTVLDALANQDIPMDRLVRDLKLPHDASRHPIFNVSFTIEPPLASIDPRWKLTQSEVSGSIAKIDLDFQLDERNDGYAARLTYSTDLFDAPTIARLFTHWQTLLEAAATSPESRLIDLPMMTAEERREIGVVRNATQREIPESTVVGLFEEQAARTPHIVAVEAGSSLLTYAELNQQANRLAWRLREEGAGRGVLVALSVERSCDMVVAVLAVLKTGAAYLPIDPDIPEERQQFILDDSKAPLVLTERSLADRFQMNAERGVRILCCDDRSANKSNPDSAALPEDLAHVLYTSGSTGKPKGVEVRHKAIVNFLQSMRRRPGFTSRDKVLAVTTLSFDIAGLELYLPLICGGCVVLANRNEARDPMLLRELLREVRPTVMQATPATWRGLIDAGWQRSPGMKILCGGEAMTRDLADQLLARSAEVWNMYGPTETTIWSTVQRVTPGEGPVPIGHPIDNTQVYTLDSGRRLVPDGVIGELYIGGAGVARGYFGRPELTAERFVQVEAADDARLYRTGDLARWRKDGTLECLGRADNQVKIRGFRVELEEIEAVMAQHPEVRAAAVKAWPDASGHLALAGYVVAGEDLDLREFLQSKLPEYMIPSVFVRLDQLPLTPNWKVDRNRLPSPDMGRERAPFVASESAEERRLAEIWESVLGVSNIGVHDDFFRAGGHSLLVPKLLSRVEQAFGLRFPMASLFEAPTIHKFAELLKNPDAWSAPPRTVMIRGNASKHPLVWVYPGAEMRGVIKHLDRPFAVAALKPEDEAALPQNFTLAQMAAILVRDIRKAQPEGPYSIGGWCDAGILAFEVAAQLLRQSEVDALVLLDSVNPVQFLRMSARQRRTSKMQYHLKRIAGLRRDLVGHYVRERVAWARERFRPQTAAVMNSYEARFSRATVDYAPAPYAGNALVLSPARMPSYRDARLHWQDVFTGPSRFQVVKGDHLGMFEEGAVEIASAISRSILAAEAGRERTASSRRAKSAAGSAG